MKIRMAVVASILGAALLASTVLAAGADDEDQRERVREAALVLTEITHADDAGIPDSLFKRATAVAVLPHVVRGAFIVGGRWGKGVVASRAADGSWGPASFLDLGGASVGFQIGGDATDVILVFVEEHSLEALLEDKVELGANASVAAGPVGRSAEIGTNATFDAAIYAYSRSKGVFAGVALDGTVISVDNSANAEAFGRTIHGKDVLSGKFPRPAVFDPFIQRLEEVAPAAR